MENMNIFMLGGISMSSIIAGVFFLRFWFSTQDRLFLLFSLSFLVEGFNRAALAMSEHPQEGQPLFYIIRLLSFCLILGAILDKNFKR